MEIAIGSIGAHIFIGTLFLDTIFQPWKSNTPIDRFAHEYYYTTLLVSAVLTFIGFYSFWKSLGGLIDKENGLRK